VAGILFVCRPSVKRFFKFFQSNLKLSCFDTASSSTTSVVFPVKRAPFYQAIRQLQYPGRK